MKLPAFTFIFLAYAFIFKAQNFVDPETKVGIMPASNNVGTSGA